MDVRVREVQVWLGTTFPDYFHYDEEGITSGSFPLEPDGMTGNRTVKALIMALQIHLHLTPVDGIWGNGATSACPTVTQNTKDSVLVKIVQSGFICKGYDPGPLDGAWGSYTQNAVQEFKADLGFTGGSESLEPLYFKSLLTTDPTKTNPTSDLRVRRVQQYLNGKYSSLYQAKLGFIPTGGHFERKTGKALIYGFQSSIGTTADGALGPKSLAKMPTLSKGSNAEEQVKILQCALICNRYPVSEINGVYDQLMEDKIKEFQYFMCLDQDSQVIPGEVNRRTWCALLMSSGDPERIPNAADTSTQLTEVQAQSLYNEGIRYIGRYLTKVKGGMDKNLTEQEVRHILNAGLKLIPIFQEDQSRLENFTYQKGYGCWRKAVDAAIRLRLPACTIYFSVDFDATEVQAKGAVTDFFRGLNDAKAVSPSIYQIGIYSARNTCTIIRSAGLADNCYISNMSTGYSGNLGYIMPADWCFDQYAKGTITADGNSFEIDKVIASGVDQAVSAVTEIGDDHWNERNESFFIGIQNATENAVPVSEVIPYIRALEDAYWEYYTVTENGPYADACVESVLYFLWHKKYTGTDFNVTLPTNLILCDYVAEHHPGLEETLDQYIREKDYVIIKDVSNRYETPDALFELHHLAVVITAYVKASLINIKPEWYAWAGDLTTSFNEIIALKNKLEGYVSDIAHARDRVGRMETEGDDVQTNYCDIFGDADGYAISTIVKSLLSDDINNKHVLSTAFEMYYDDSVDNPLQAHFTKRFYYLLNNLPATVYSIEKISEMLYDYFMDNSQWLLMFMKGDVDKDNYQHLSIMKACCTAFAEFVMHYYKVQK